MHEAVNKSNMLSLKFQFNKCLLCRKGLCYLRHFTQKLSFYIMFFKNIFIAIGRDGVTKVPTKLLVCSELKGRTLELCNLGANP